MLSFLCVQLNEHVQIIRRLKGERVSSCCNDDTQMRARRLFSIVIGGWLVFVMSVPAMSQQLLITAQLSSPIVIHDSEKSVVPEYAALAEWTRRNGHLLSMPAEFAEKFDFGEQKLPMIRKAFLNHATGMAYGFIVVQLGATEEWIMQRRSGLEPGETIFWQISKAGDVIRTVRASGAVSVVPNGDYANHFRETEEFLFEEMKKNQP